ncbi:MAG: polysaccharide biosynthesis/export family protein [Gammaproteobacteria bacterium]|nr:polysaccharide biosynthesis/export family protein [Gammaproteobacteria bacterium]MDX2461081.1 polysaccharide biosynthesis/export family protein [Gammaproteobacteria bacterium]
MRPWLFLLFAFLLVPGPVEATDWGGQGGGSSARLLLAQVAASEAPSGDPHQPSDAEPRAYRVDTGDRISVTVYQEPDLSVNGVRVKANGTIALPLLGDLKVAGLTSQGLHNLITARLLDGYLKTPSVAVSIDSYRLYFIKGEVTRPGGYSFVDGLTVAKAVALAGGFTVRASERSISLVRESDPETPIESVGPNSAILPGDIITVGESFF